MYQGMGKITSGYHYKQIPNIMILEKKQSPLLLYQGMDKGQSTYSKVLSLMSTEHIIF